MYPSEWRMEIIMIRKSLIESIFEAASIERWNDHIRPSRGFSELDKQAHKMVYAYTLSQISGNVDLRKLIEGGIFEFLQRLLLTDIKPPVYHKLMKQKGDELNRWCIEQIKWEIESIPQGFIKKFERYLMDKSYSSNEKNILNAAHYLATKWEFDIIYDMCHNYYGIEDTKREIDGKIGSFEEFGYFKKYQMDNNLKSFTAMIGQLRFQQRWSRSPRVPETSVISHMFIVAVLAYLCSCEIDASDERTINNFFGGLFHDIPEVLTRDIISPVKSSVEGLDEIIKNIENEQMNDLLYPLIPESWGKQISYYTSDEFSSKIIVGGKIKFVTSSEINAKYNDDKFSPIDGEIIRACDHLAACIETYASHSYGISTHTLLDANSSLYKQYKNVTIAGLDFGSMFDYFRI